MQIRVNIRLLADDDRSPVQVFESNTFAFQYPLPDGLAEKIGAWLVETSAKLPKAPPTP